MLGLSQKRITATFAFGALLCGSTGASCFKLSIRLVWSEFVCTCTRQQPDGWWGLAEGDGFTTAARCDQLPIHSTVPKLALRRMQILLSSGDFFEDAEA